MLQIEQLRALAQTAVVHAEAFHQVKLSDISLTDETPLAAVDEILDKQRAQNCDGRLQAVADCYGAWLGQQAVDSKLGQWCGLDEPAAPRLEIGGILASPIDAIRRRLINADAPSITSLWQQMLGWSDKTSAGRDAALAHNQAAWDRIVDDPKFIRRPSEKIEVDEAIELVDPWLRVAIKPNLRVLCLGAGGGRHAPIYAILGCEVTVVDISPKQLEFDREWSTSTGVPIETICESIDDLGSLGNRKFDIIIQPVSSCYIPDIFRMYVAVAKLLDNDGLYVSQHKQPASLQALLIGTDHGFAYQLAIPAFDGEVVLTSNHEVSLGERETVQFVHSLDLMLGSLCRAGFVIEDIAEPQRADAFDIPGSPCHKASYAPPYLRIKARRR